MSEPTQPVVETVGLCKTFKDFWRRPRVEAVQDLNLQIRAGEVFGLLGPNGSGKTTTIKMLLGLLYPTRGRISVLGRPPTDVSVKARIGFLPEESYLYRFLVARETLDYYGRLFRIPSRIRRDRIDRLLDMVGLRHEANRPIGEYSKGMARRIGLAQALINDPEFLILDEPTAGLDPIGTKQIKDVIRALGSKGKTILLSSHMLADVEDVCDRVTILYGGQERANGDIRELLRERDVTLITVPSLADPTLEQVRNVIRRCENKEILSVSNPRVRLEDYFLRIVDEAHAANVRTYGARRGGALPDFLQQKAEPSAQEVVESLVDASSRKENKVERVGSTTGSPEPEPAREVVEQLLAKGSEEPETNTKTPELSPKAEGRDAQPLPTTGDQEVIEGLLKAGHGEDRNTPSAETPGEPKAGSKP
ncbi:MAG: ABC transporter ATP-binding protein [Planctomycetes bacterium]|nr:ABC transporter ATP-binding protein [Planctomycetota bacterium]